MGWLATLAFFGATLTGFPAQADEIRHCPVQNAEGVFSYQLFTSPRPALCGGTVVSVAPDQGSCRLGFLTSAHCLVKPGEQAPDRKIRRGDRLRTRLGVLRVRDILVHPKYLASLVQSGRRFQPMTDLALVVAEGSQCPASVTPLLSPSQCQITDKAFPFLLACPGEKAGLTLEPVFAAGGYSQRALQSMGLEMGSNSPWRGYSRSRKGCSGGAWLDYSESGQCGYSVQGVCGVHAGHAKTTSELRDSRAAPVRSGPWTSWCQSLGRWGLSCPVSDSDDAFGPAHN